MNLDKVADILERERKTDRLINRAIVTVEALEDLRSKANDEDILDPDGPDNIDDDWLNVFETHAANASSDRLRKLWGRILSGEIRKPGSFSLTTLRVLSEIDQQTAVLFQKHVTGILENSFLVRCDSPKGQELIEMTALEEVGLLQDVNGMLGADQEFDRNGQVVFRNGPLVLLMKGMTGNKFRVPLIKITRSGQEILGILPKENPDACLRRVASIARPASSSIELALLISSDASGRISLNPIEKIL